MVCCFELICICLVCELKKIRKALLEDRHNEIEKRNSTHTCTAKLLRRMRVRMQSGRKSSRGRAVAKVDGRALSVMDGVLYSMIGFELASLASA